MVLNKRKREKKEERGMISKMENQNNFFGGFR